MDDFEVVVTGGGLAGLVAALAVARGGRKVALITPKAAVGDERTTALMDHSIRFMDRLGLWEEIAPTAAPLCVMQIIDATDRLLRAPTAQFRSADIGLYAFGYNIPNRGLVETLQAAVAAEPNITPIEAAVRSLATSDEVALLTLEDGSTVTASFVIGADGRRSVVRQSVGIGQRNWSYPQSAVVLNFGHELSHGNISTEFHTPSGPFTQVPLPGKRSSLVWVVKPDEAQRLLKMSPEALSALVETRMQSMLGKVTVEPGFQAWPLSSMMADRFGKGRVALVGEAGHAFPPIGAQGLNLSLRDIITLCEMLATSTGSTIASNTGDRFNRRRRPDIMSRTFGVDMLNRSLLSEFLPVQMMRAGGMHLLSAFPPLRNLAMREGVEPGRGLLSFVETLRNEVRR